MAIYAVNEIHRRLKNCTARSCSSAASRVLTILHHEPTPAREITPDLPHDVEKILQRCLRKRGSGVARSLGKCQTAEPDFRGMVCLLCPKNPFCSPRRRRPKSRSPSVITIRE